MKISASNAVDNQHGFQNSMASKQHGLQTARLTKSIITTSWAQHVMKEWVGRSHINR